MQNIIALLQDALTGATAIFYYKGKTTLFRVYLLPAQHFGNVFLCGENIINMFV